MNTRFSGVTHITGPNAGAFVYKANEENGTAVSACEGNEAFYMDGNNAKKLMQDIFDVEYPPELEGKTGTEIGEMVYGNVAQYTDMLKKLFAVNMLEANQKIMKYGRAVKTLGKDIDGNPVKEITT